MKNHHFRLAPLLALAGALTASTARAQPTSDPAPATDAASDEATPSGAGTADEPESPETQHAREAFRLGSALASQGQWSDALAAFQRARRLRPHPVTTYNIGYVQRALGRLTLARKNLREALSGTLPPDLQKEAQGYLSEIEPKLARVAVTLTSENTAVAVDGRPLEVESPGARPVLVAGTLEPGPGEEPPTATFDLLVDPGAHVFVLSREGAKDSVVNQSFEPGTSIGLRLGVVVEVRSDDRPAATPTPAPGPDATADVEPGGAPRWPVWVAFGVGGAGIAAGSVLGGLAIKKRNDLDSVCDQPDQCPDDEQGNIDSMKGMALGSNIAFGVGGAGVAAGVLLLLLLDDEPASEVRASRSPHAEPWLGLGSAGVRGTF